MINVVAAVIKKDGKILICQKRKGEFKNLWEFPGGKIEENEDNETALKREIREELSLNIKIERFINTINYQYPTFLLKMHCYFSTIKNGSLEIKEHKNAIFITKDELKYYQFLPADIALVKELDK